MTMADPPPAANPQADGFGNNPRCLRRDMSNYLASTYGKTSDIVDLLTHYATIGSFQNKMQAVDPDNGGIGVHAVGHYTISGDPGSDPFISPNDPAFWMHHGMIDRTWSIWQTLDLPNRMQVIDGTTILRGAGVVATLEDWVTLDVLAEREYQIKELVSTVDGPFCYTYE
jgi:tyrosinase